MIKLPDDIQALLPHVTDHEYFSEIKPEIRKVSHELDLKNNKIIIESYKSLVKEAPDITVDEYIGAAAKALNLPIRRLRRIFRKAGLLN